MSKYDGGPAFPGDYETRTDQGRGHLVQRHDSGMSLRDYLAAKAMQSLCSARENDDFRYGNDDLAQMAYSVADAMLKERAK